jgi:hypothetical protein
MSQPMTAPATEQPPAFEIVEAGPGHRVASNGAISLSLLDAGGRLFRRRGVVGMATKPAGEMVLPQLNGLAGELLANPAMPADEVVGRLLALAGLVPITKPRRIEWAVAELDGVRVYTDGSAVIVTKQDLMP